DFDDVHVLGIELRAHIGGDVSVGDRDAVDEPGNLMAAPDVELIVNHVGAGSVCGDEVEAVGAGCAWGFRDRLAAHADGSGRGCGVDGLRGLANLDAFGNTGDVEWEMT